MDYCNIRGYCYRNFISYGIVKNNLHKILALQCNVVAYSTLYEVRSQGPAPPMVDRLAYTLSCQKYLEITLKYFYCLVLTIFLFACSSTKQKVEVYKDNNTFEQDSLSNYLLFEYVNSLTEADYYTLLDSVKAETSNDFFTLRMAYTKTDDYSPYDIEMNDSFKKIRTLIDQDNFDDALRIIEEIHAYNFVSITSHLFCGYIYKQKNDLITPSSNLYSMQISNNNFYYSDENRRIVCSVPFSDLMEK